MHRQIRIFHLCTGLFCLPILMGYGLSAVALAHRSWFATGRLVRMHTHVPPANGRVLLGMASAGLLILGATGFVLWMKNQSQRRLGFALLAVGGGITVALIVSMRLG